jgi:cytoskeletal protein CcmA (bactofilin family)
MMRGQQEDRMATDPRASIDERRVAAWIGRALRIEGRIVSEENLTIDGHIEGTIEVGDHTLTIGPSAAVKADLTARSITVSGTVTGNLTASERVDLRPSATVTGDIITPRLTMDDGALVKGKVEAGKRKTQA